MNRVWNRILWAGLSALPLVAAFTLSEFLVNRSIVPRFLMPSPSDVWRALTQESQDLWVALFQTGSNAFIGFFLSVALGVGFGILLASAGWLEKVFYPYAVFFQTVPIVAIAPLLVIWFGFGRPTVVAASLIVSVFPVIASTLSGFRSTDPNLVDLFKLYGATRIGRIFKLRLPLALPHILTGIRIAGGLAVIGAIVGEFIAGGGLGGVIDEARAQQRVDRVFAAIFLSSLLGLVVFGLVNGLHRYLLRHWHPSETQK